MLIQKDGGDYLIIWQMALFLSGIIVCFVLLATLFAVLKGIYVSFFERK